MNLDHATPELFAALAKAQNAVENAHKGSLNPHFKNRYADLAEVLNTVRPVFSECGLSIIQETSFDGSLVSVTTALCHEKGGFVSSTASCVPAKADAQGVGAATTYLRRYSLAAITGVAQEDDDGQSASHPVKANPVKSVAASVQSPEVLFATTDELIKLRHRVTHLQVNEPAFLRKLGVESFITMPANKVQIAHGLLDLKENDLINKAAMSMAQIEPA